MYCFLALMNSSELQRLDLWIEKHFSNITEGDVILYYFMPSFDVQKTVQTLLFLTHDP